MKTLILLATCLSVGAAAPAFARNATATPIPDEIVGTLDAPTLDYLTSRSRISVGMQRGTVLEQIGQPSSLPHPDVWVFQNFRASNVFNAERYDMLVVVFKNNKVAQVTLTSENAVRLATARRKAAAESVTTQ